MVRIGQLRQRVTLQRPVAGQADTFGAATADWQDVATVWAEVTDLPAAEVVVGDRVVLRQAYRVVIRYRSDVLTTWRVKWKDKLMPIAAVVGLSDRRGQVVITCWEST